MVLYKTCMFKHCKLLTMPLEDCSSGITLNILLSILIPILLSFILFIMNKTISGAKSGIISKRRDRCSILFANTTCAKVNNYIQCKILTIETYNLNQQFSSSFIVLCNVIGKASMYVVCNLWASMCQTPAKRVF